MEVAFDAVREKVKRKYGGRCLGKNFYVRDYGRRSWLIYYGPKNDFLAFVVSWSYSRNSFILKNWHSIQKCNLKALLAEFLCYPSFIRYMERVGVDPGAIIPIGGNTANEFNIYYY